jgi:CBS-domain-containing membrane protein
MWAHNCGMLPVVGENGKLAGVITDRDVCIRMGTRNRVAGDLTVGEIATKRAITCRPEEEIHEALGTMASKQMRLPVLNDEGMPLGGLSIDDIVRHGDWNKSAGCCELTSGEMIRGLKRIYGQQMPVVHVRAATAK